MDAAVFRRLLGQEGERLLADIAVAYSDGDELALGEHFRASYPPELVAAAMSQVSLRIDAVEKFGADAAALFFTQPGLEQATHRVVAAHRADRVLRTRGSPIVDLCCGIGADLIAFARTGADVEAVDRDPLAAAIAQANLRTLGLEGHVIVADAETHPVQPGTTVFADPARRGPAGRTFDPRRYSPPWSFIESLLRSDAVIKVAPGIDHALVPDGVEVEWVSLAGRLREAVLWSGHLTGGTRRRATVLDVGGAGAALTESDDPGTAEIRPVGEFVYEPDDAVVRAHLVTGFAALVDGWLIEPHLAYVSSDRLVATPLGRAYRVLEQLPYKEKALRDALRQRGVGSLTIKKRGVSVTPEELRRRLRLSGSQQATIVLTRTPRSAVALLVDPVGPDPDG